MLRVVFGLVAVCFAVCVVNLSRFMGTPWDVTIMFVVGLLLWGVTTSMVLYVRYQVQIEEAELCYPILIGLLFTTFIPVLDHKAGVRSTLPNFNPMIEYYGLFWVQFLVAVGLIVIGYIILFIKRKER